jgi:flavin-dependent dehydrogenase
MRCRVLVVGAGPAGADLARQLAANGEDVLLVDRLPDLRRAAFSSAALPLASLDRFGLPASVVAQRWSGWELLGPGDSRRRWHGAQPQGVVLDFAALREWLVGEAQRWGARVWLGHRALTCHQDLDGVHTILRRSDGSQQRIHSDWVIDATGQERSLLGDPPAAGPGAETLVSGVGLEWLVEVPRSCWERWSDRLAFCLGSDWVAQGYGWVFPMQAPQLKLGVCRLLDPSREQPPLGGVLQRLIERLLEPAERQAMAVVDRHGGLIRSSIRRREPHRNGRLVGLGDVVSTANLLGGEGIRHALTSSRVLAPLLLEELGRERSGGVSGRRTQGSVSLPESSAALGSLQRKHERKRPDGHGLDRYPLELRRALGWRWSLSGRLARRTWLGLHSETADRRLAFLLKTLERENATALSDLLFAYRFERYGMRALPYLLGLR